MMSFGFENELCRITASFWRNRTFIVNVMEMLSEQMTVEAGVQQGSLLGSVLYNIFLRTFHVYPRVNLLLIYADVILIAATRPRALTIDRYLGRLFDFYCRWGMRLNMDQKNCMGGVQTASSTSELFFTKILNTTDILISYWPIYCAVGEVSVTILDCFFIGRLLDLYVICFPSLVWYFILPDEKVKCMGEMQTVCVCRPTTCHYFP